MPILSAVRIMFCIDADIAETSAIFANRINLLSNRLIFLLKERSLKMTINDREFFTVAELVFRIAFPATPIVFVLFNNIAAIRSMYDRLVMTRNFQG